MTREELVENFTVGVERERTKLKLTQAQLADKLNISVSAYKKMVAGEVAKIDVYTAYRMHELTGKWICELCGDTSEELQIVSQLRSLSSSQLKFVSGVINFESEFRQEMEEMKEDTENYVTLMTPMGDLEDGMIWDSAHLEKINAGAYRKRFGEDLNCAIKITSNNLNPVYYIGDILLVSQKPLRNGDTGIFINRESGCAYVRKFYHSNPCRLEPINGYGVTITIDSYDKEDMDKWIWFGRVLCKMR